MPTIQRLILMDTPSGASISIDLETLSDVMIDKEGYLNLTDSSDKSRLISGENNYLKLKMSEIIDLKNEYNVWIREEKISEKALSYAIEKAMKISEEAIKSSALQLISKESEIILNKMKDTSKENKELYRELNTSINTVKQLSSEVKELKSIIISLKSEIFEG